MAKLARGFGRRLDQWIPALADHMIVVTDDISRQLVSNHGFEPHRITVVPNGVEVNSFAAVSMTAAEPGLLVYTGTLAPYQGIDLMLEAFARALAVRPKLRLRLLITASFEPFMPMAERLGVAHAIEIIQDSFSALPERLSQASVALMPRVECPGLPQKLLNYMAAGKAIVSFAGFGQAARARGDRPDRAEPGYCRLRQRDRPPERRPGTGSRLGMAARDLILDTATWDRAAKRCEAVYAGVVGARASAMTSPDADASGLCRLPPASLRREEQVTPVP